MVARTKSTIGRVPFHWAGMVTIAGLVLACAGCTQPRKHGSSGGKQTATPTAVGTPSGTSSALPSASLTASAASRGQGPRPSVDFVKGAAVRVEWQGSWWPAKILAVDGARYQIRYDGYGAQWDEWVGLKRLRVLCKPCPAGYRGETTPGCRCPPDFEGVEVPEGSKLIAREDRPGHHGGNSAQRWLLSPLAPAETAAFFAQQPGATTMAALSYTVAGWTVTVMPLEPIPKKRHGQSLVASVPSGFRAWIKLNHDTPPPPCKPCPPGMVRASTSTCGCMPRQGR